MAEMVLAAVMEELADRVRDATDGVDRAYGWPNPTVEPPAFVVGYPELIELDLTMARGSDRAEYPCWLICGYAEERSARDVLSSFLLNLKEALDGSASGVWASARASSITIESVETAEITYLAARFTVDVIT